jgi:DNA-binding beta-propeller fold protein YncE
VPKTQDDFPRVFSALLGTFIAILLAAGARAQTSATFGQVIALGGIPSDMVLDETRQRLYLINSTANRVDVYDYVGQSLIGSIAVGQRPLGAAISADASFLYVANHDAATLSVISLSSTSPGVVTATVSLPAHPQGVETELSGRVLICTDGSGTGNASNTLLIYDPNLPGSSQVQAVVVPPPAATPPTLAPITAKPSTQINGRLKRTPDGSYIIGVNSVNSNASTVVYVYEPASTTVLNSRTVVGQSSTLSIAPDGASFMAGFTLYDTATLNVLAQQSTENAPFTMTGSFATTFNVGGSAFSPDGTTLYSAFNTAALTTPPPTPTASTLLISDPKSLAIKLGINLPESIIDKFVITSDGANAWALSLSGVTYLPLSTLYTYPILMPSSTAVFLSQNDCNPGEAQATLKINNIGGGELTYAVPSTVPTALTVNTSSGLAPATLTFTMDPGRSAVVRVPGTNLYSGAGTDSGTPVSIQLVSSNAINVPPAILVYMNYRDSTMRGLIYPLPTVPNSTVTANAGHADIVLDQSRNLIYITNTGYNRVEVFNTQTLQFQIPIQVGQLPLQMAMGLDGSTLYVANTGGETVSIVDLDAQQVVDTIVFPPVPRNANAAVVNVHAMGVGLSGLELVLSNGDLWSVSGDQATPRTGTFVTGVSATGAQTPIASPSSMLASADGSSILLLGGSGEAYRYDGLNDVFTTSNQLFTTPISGYYGPLGLSPDATYMLANGLVVNSSLSVIGGAASPGLIPVNPPSLPGQVGSIAQNPLRNVAAVSPMDDRYFFRMTTPVRASITATITDSIYTTLQKVDTLTGATTTVANMPENPIFSLFGATRTNIPTRQMAVDSNGTVYALTLSGLSVLPTTPTTTATQPQIAAKGGVVNAADGSTKYAPGSFIQINGTNLASSATATSIPAPTVLGGSCALIDGVPLPLLSTSPGQMVAQIPTTVLGGDNVLEVRSLANAQRSAPMVLALQK